MTKDSIDENPELQAFLAAHPDPHFLDVFYCDLSGIIRGKRYPAAQMEKILRTGLAVPGSVFLLSVTGDNMDPLGLGFSDGDPDELARVVRGTLAPVPWSDTPGAQALLSLEGPDGTPYYFEPRNVLKRVCDRFDELRLRPVVAFELEFYLIDPVRMPDGLPQPPLSPVTGERYQTTQVYGMADLEDFAGFMTDVSDSCANQGVRTGAISAEYAPGQFEINLQHCDSPLRAADECVMFKRAVQSIARKRGLQATFMSKPYPGQAGSGLHLHVSMLDGDGVNVFDGGGLAGRPDSVTDTLRHAVGGALIAMEESMAIFAPNVNAYRRFEPNLFVPVRPSWGFENRSTAIRIPTGDGAARRIEHRVAGAEANPYLTLAAVLAGIHHGMTRRLVPDESFVGNAGEIRDENLPLRLRPALDRLSRGTVLNDYLGDTYLRAYVECKERELDEYEDCLSRKEYDWYLQP